MIGSRDPNTAREYLIDEYARLVHTSICTSRPRTGSTTNDAFRIANKLRSELLAGERTLSAIGVRDEKFKLEARCAYCGKDANSLDHLIPRLRNGPDSADNLVPACRRCSSSKGGRDVLRWAESKGFMPMRVMRRHLVLAYCWTDRAGLLDSTLESLIESDPPFVVGEYQWKLARRGAAILTEKQQR